jgi:hypothetical protein
MGEVKAPLMARAAIAALLLLLASCADFDLYSMMNGELPGGALEISPVAAQVVVGTICDFSARGGSPPYSFAIFSGNGSIDPNSGLYTAPAFPSSDIIQVQDKNGATSQAVATVTF